jgi:hypothetical protein
MNAKQLTYNDLPPEAVKAAANMVRGILYNLDDAPYDEELVAKNTALHVLDAAGWTPVPTSEEGRE